MISTVYFVRHANSIFEAGKEKERGITESGKQLAQQIAYKLSTIEFQAAYSSDYNRAIQTIEPLVNNKQLSLTLVEDLRERNIGNIEPYTFQEAKRKVYEDFTFFFPQGESSIEAQHRACNVIKELLRKHRGETILIGTHGDIFTLILNYFDKQYHYSFWQSTTMPDVYKVQFMNDVIIEVERCWE